MTSVNASRLENAKESLAVEVRSALRGETKESVALLLRPDRLPLAVVTDARGVSCSRVISYVDLIATLDDSATVSALCRKETEILNLTVPPDGTLLFDLSRTSSSNTYVLTGYVPPQTHLFCLEGRTPGGTEKEFTTYDIGLPHLVYRAIWDEAVARVTKLSLCLASPELEGRPTPETDLYCWPFSNVYGLFGGVREGVCWHGFERIATPLHEVPERVVKLFVGLPNDADLYRPSISPATDLPQSYAGLLEEIEARGGVAHDWLVPTGTTARELHSQEGRGR